MSLYFMFYKMSLKIQTLIKVKYDYQTIFDIFALLLSWIHTTATATRY